MVLEYEITLTKRNRDDVKGNVKTTVSQIEKADSSKIKCLIIFSFAFWLFESIKKFIKNIKIKI